MKAYFISLKERTPHRYRYIVKHLRERGFEPVEVPAVDGYRLSPEELETLVNLPFFRNLDPYSNSNGAIGCALSHLNAYRLIVDGDEPWGLIFEDDIRLAPDALETVREAVKHVGEYSLFLLGYTFEVDLSRYNALPITSRRILYLPMKFGFYGTLGYIVGRKAAECIMKFNMPVSYPPDWWHIFHENGCFKEIRLLYPPLIDVVGFRSTTFPHEKVSFHKVKGKIAELVDRINIPILTRLIKDRRASVFNKTRRKFVFYDEPSPIFSS